METVWETLGESSTRRPSKSPQLFEEKVTTRSPSPPDPPDTLEPRREVAFSAEVTVIPASEGELPTTEWIVASPLIAPAEEVLEDDEALYSLDGELRDRSN